MTNTQKYILYVTSVLVVVLGIYIITHKSAPAKQTVIQSYGATGDTYASLPMASIGVNTSSSTFAQLCNTSGRDRVVSTLFLTLATPNSYGTSTQQQIQAATTTSGASGLSGNTNYLLSQIMQPSISGGAYIVGSTTVGFTATTTFNGKSVTTRIWANNSCINFVNSSTTNVAVGLNETAGADTLLGSTTSGFAGVEYYPQ